MVEMFNITSLRKIGNMKLSVFLIVLIVFLSGCTKQNEVRNHEISSAEIAQTSNDNHVNSAELLTERLYLKISVNENEFFASLSDNVTVEALIEMLPLSLSMSDLNQNEKYYYLNSNLPIDPNKVELIKKGDIMLFGSNCLVLFYDSFITNYSYTSIGNIDDTVGFAEALGNGEVEISISLVNNSN